MHVTADTTLASPKLRRLVTVTPAPAPAEVRGSRPRTTLAQFLFHAAFWTALCALTYWSVDTGIRIREDIWNATKLIRMEGDIVNGWNWGRGTATVGVVKMFDDLYAKQGSKPIPDYGLDYPPLRLAIMTKWAMWTEKVWGLKKDKAGNAIWQTSYEFSSPVLGLNTLAEMLSSIAVFLTVRLWVKRGERRKSIDPTLENRKRFPYRATVAGFIGALLFWFNPAVIWDAHVFPQWDMWNMPFFLFAVFFASLNMWGTVGFLLGFGALIKGQLLSVAAIFVLWPIFMGQPLGALRVVIGFAVAPALALWPWLVREQRTVVWLCQILIAGMIMVPVVFFRRLRWAWLPCSVAAGFLIAWPILRLGGDWRKYGLACTLVLLTFVPIMRKRFLPHALLATIAAAIFLSVPLHNGSMSWLYVGYEYGARKYPGMGTLSASNLPRIMHDRFGWESLGPNGLLDFGPPIDWPIVSDVAQWKRETIGDRFLIFHDHELDAPLQMHVKTFLTTIFAITLVLCAIGAAIHTRRKDPRLMVALVAPWVLFFTLSPQMHNRYLVWGAAATALLVASGTGMTLLGIFVTLVCWSMMAVDQFAIKPKLFPEWYNTLHGMHIDIAWGLILAAAVMLYVAVKPRRKEPISVDESLPLVAV